MLKLLQDVEEFGLDLEDWHIYYVLLGYDQTILVIFDLNDRIDIDVYFLDMLDDI